MLLVCAGVAVPVLAWGLMIIIHHRPVLKGSNPCGYSSCTTLTPGSTRVASCFVLWLSFPVLAKAGCSSLQMCEWCSGCPMLQLGCNSSIAYLHLLAFLVDLKAFFSNFYWPVTIPYPNRF
ncbi:hypothetical protein COO60DRAFT_885341 [Scenedesmus sp. NREL 46B-D3]|nr:hypothetical protein COO60DRAFT_885341 [Scenedesmus sp. NREL 46B-D3]